MRDINILEYIPQAVIRARSAKRDSRRAPKESLVYHMIEAIPIEVTPIAFSLGIARSVP